MTSIMMAFNLALTKVLVKNGLLEKQQLIDEFKEVRKYVGHQSPIAVADKEVLDFLELQEEDV